MNLATSKRDVEQLLGRTVDLANSAIRSGKLRYLDGSSNERALFELLQEACQVEGFSTETVELVSGHKFPDVIFRTAHIGVEIKGHKQGDRILGNSIMGSTPSLRDPVAIYLLAWNDSEQRVIWRDYFDCVVGAEVTHSPRFVLKPNCSAEESLFGDGPNQIGDAKNVCLGSDGFKSEIILARMRAKALAEGNIPWWVSPHEDDEIYAATEAQKQLSIVKYSSLDPNSERKSFLKTLLIGFPELFGKSTTKYDVPLVWSLLRKSILISRDAFSAGGQVEVVIPSICSQKTLKLPKIFDRAKTLFDSSVEVSRSDIDDICQSQGLNNEDLLRFLKNRIVESGIAKHRIYVVHENCECSQISQDDFALRLTEWMLKGFEVNSIVRTI